MEETIGLWNQHHDLHEWIMANCADGQPEGDCLLNAEDMRNISLACTVLKIKGTVPDEELETIKQDLQTALAETDEDSLYGPTFIYSAWQ